MSRVTQEERQAAADRLNAARAAVSQSKTNNALAVPTAMMPPPGGTPDYFGSPNWAFSPAIRKFIDSLPGLNTPNNLGQSLPVAVADTITYPGTDYYEIELRQYTEKMHTDLPPTTLRGYVQTNNGTDANGQNTLVPAAIHYLGPIIVAEKDKPVRIKFINKLPTGMDGDLFLPVDTSVMGAGMGPLEMDVSPGNPLNYTQNRATLHLHGGRTPWISDGTPHQWITPAGENTDYPEGVSVSNVPDMPDPGPGAQTFFYTNQQSARLMFYHDHSFGITRLNVYAGEAGGYLITDPTETALINDGVIPDVQIPLFIQDKSFVDAATVLETDPTWNWGTGMADMDGIRPPVTGDLWYPHVYSPAQNPADLSGMNAYGRWHYGPWFWPPTNEIEYPPVPNPYYDPMNAPWEPEYMPGVPHPSMPGESFQDTAMVNGTAFPYLEVQPKAYRFRILNVANDRFFNLQLYESDPLVVSADNRANTEIKMVPAVLTQGFPETWPTDGREGGVPDPTTAGPQWIQIGTEGGFLPAPAVVPHQPVVWNLDPTTFNFGNVSEHSLLVAPAERADVIVDFSAYAGKTLILYNDAPAAFPALDARYDYYTGAPDLTETGGHPGPQAGYGPNTRTIMQFRVANVAPAAAFDAEGLEAAWASTNATQGVFEASQEPIIIPDARYNSAYNDVFPADTYVRIYQNSKTFKNILGTTLSIPMQPKAIQDEMGEAFDEYGRMSGKLGVELPNTNANNQNFILQAFIDPPTEIINDSVSVSPVTAGDGTQLWKITHNGVDTHPIHFHLFDVQLINRVGWDGGIRPPDDNELGWKDTVRVSPLEDTIVALRAVSPKQPFGIPDSIRPLNPSMPLGSEEGFSRIDPLTGEPLLTETVNSMFNFGWEYVWHCHILSHEEMDMMRPIVFNVARALPTAPVLNTSVAGAQINLNWSDATPAGALATWGDPANEVGFRIERATGANDAFSVIATAPANTTNYIDAAVVFGMDYEYRIVAFNAAGNSLSNTEATGLGVAQGSPLAPTNLTATVSSPQRINLSWTDRASNETGFTIQRATGNGAFAQIGTIGPRSSSGNTVTYVDTTVVPDTSYRYRVTAVNAAGTSPFSNIATATTPNLMPPTNLTATVNTAQRITLSWTDNAANETGFVVQRATGNGAFAQIGTTGPRTSAGNTATYVDTTVVMNTSYRYRVAAVNATGTSAFSNIAAVTTPNLAPPSNLTATANSPQRVTLSWTDNGANETGFVIQRATGTGAFAQIGTTGPRSSSGNTATYVNTTVAPNTTYRYRVAAVYAAGTSAFSNIATVTTPNLVPPSNMTATANNSRRVTLRWTDNTSNETGFRIQRATGNGAFAQIATALPRSGTGNTATYVDTTAVPNTTYRYRVAAMNAAGTSAYSNIATVTTPNLTAPTNLTATAARNGTTDSVRLRWADQSTNETGFRIHRATNAAFTGGLTSTVGANVVTVNLTGLSRNITYYFRVQATNALGSSGWSNAVSVLTP